MGELRLLMNGEALQGKSILVTCQFLVNYLWLY